MPQLWVLIRALYPAALLLAAAASTSASIIPTESTRVFERASTCGANFSPCSQPGLPANFCCEADATCNLLAANTTVLCCPKNANCDTISPITCDLGLQDPATNPSAEIKTTVLNGILTTCAGQCCPFGYSCNGKNCVKDADQSKKPPVKAPTSSSKTTSPTATSTHGSSTTVAVSGVSSASASASAAPSTQTPTTSPTGTASTVTIVGGVIGGLVGLALLILAVVMIRHRRKKTLREKQALQRQDSTSSFGNIISNPVPHANYPSQRLDFLAKSHPTGSPKSYAPSSPTAVASPRSQKTTQKDGFSEVKEYYGNTGFMPPNSPYSPYARRPDSQMSDVPRSYHASAEITGLRSLTHWPGANSSANSTPTKKPSQKKGKNIPLNDRARDFAPAPLVTITPATNDDGLRDGARGRFGERGRERYPSESEGESINIFADPLMVPGGAGGTRPESSATTWSNIQQRADNAIHGEGGNGRSKLGESPLRR
ncbi:uncharacterized protein F4807DRAFT_206823 [Annulohypoxylon truncatum]|uniref:uncharacterized protein n=1 Tax=Annulohypoxylon truncatum TaxID=327061 RepID=UPI002007B0A3|nr:uncharacterized protein F4807DRAFT_206823 [Annulohypoxylon truncatum]KAI1213949.1 hypothetical protein F4807DRAFT_206823 [Annulohypoxylon truncatum]